MRCYICNYSNEDIRKFFTYQDDKITCYACRQASIRTFVNEPVVGTIGDATDITTLLDELENRIPALFKGPICPAEDCDCSYKSGCKILLDK